MVMIRKRCTDYPFIYRVDLSQATCPESFSARFCALGEDDRYCESPRLALENTQPSGWAQEKIANCMQVIVVDAGEGTMGDFVRMLVQDLVSGLQSRQQGRIVRRAQGPLRSSG